MGLCPKPLFASLDDGLLMRARPSYSHYASLNYPEIYCQMLVFRSPIKL